MQTIHTDYKIKINNENDQSEEKQGTVKQYKVKKSMTKDPITNQFIQSLSKNTINENLTKNLIPMSFIDKLSTSIANAILYNSYDKDITINLDDGDINLAKESLQSLIYESITSQEFYKAFSPLKDYIESLIQSKKFSESITPIRRLADERNIMDIINNADIKALDIHGNAFIMHKHDKKYVMDKIDEIIKLQNELNMSFEDVMLSGKIRFCTLEYMDNMRVVDMPEDIFIYLTKNNFTQGFITQLFRNQLEFNYNFVESFRLLLKAGKNLANKQNMLGDNRDIVEVVKSNLNPYTEIQLTQAFKEKFGSEKYSKLVFYCIDLNINMNTIMYRVLHKEMDSDKAIDLGMIEHYKYGVGFSRIRTNYSSLNVKPFSENEVFYKIVREHINNGQEN